MAPPQNLEAEQSVLGAVLLSDTALPALIIDERLNPEDFYRESHGRIYQAMLDLHGHGEPVDSLTLVEHLKQAGDLDSVGGAAAIELLAGSVPAVGNLRNYARIVKENAMLRRLLHAAYDIQANVHNHEALPRDLVDMAERSILEVAHEDSRKDFRSAEQLLDAELDKLQKLSLEGNPMTGTPSGFEDLDTITGGFQPGNLIILAARPSMGKSALMVNFAENAALASNKAVALFSLEMSEGELAQRFIASQASIKGDDLRKGRVPQSRWGKILAASGAAGGVQALRRRLVGPQRARRAREVPAAGAAARGRARADPDRLPAADAGGRHGREPGRADRHHLARPEDARA